MKNHFFCRDALEINLIPSLTVILLLLFVLHFDTFEWSLLSFFFFFLSFYSRTDDNLSSIPKYSWITFDCLAPNFRGYFVIEDKGIFSNSFRLLAFLNFNLPVDLFLFNFSTFSGFRSIYSLVIFFRPLGSKCLTFSSR